MTDEEESEDRKKKKRSRWRLRLDNIKAEWPVSGGLTLTGTGVVGVIVVVVAWWFLHQTPSQIEVPNLAGMSHTTAEAQLKDAGLTPGKTEEQGSDQPAGTVLRSDPSPGTKLNKGASVNLVIASSPGQPDSSSAMPSPAELNPGELNPGPAVVNPSPSVPEVPESSTEPTSANPGQVTAMATYTSLITSPASSVEQGSPVTLTARVGPDGAAGTVQFKDGSANLGKPVTVVNGTASGSTSSLAVGSHQLTAVFSPADSATYKSSTSPPVTFEVTTPASAPR